MPCLHSIQSPKIKFDSDGLSAKLTAKMFRMFSWGFYVTIVNTSFGIFYSQFFH